jgi:dTDP-4-dehydrorhamnose 3,5-epimerase
VRAESLAIPGAFVLESPVWGDERGLFREWFQLDDLAEAGGFSPRQANLSISSRDVVRGVHYSLAPEGQAKIVTCAMGELDDVVVDLRVGSPAFGRVEVVTLRAEEGRGVLLPPGVGHGFVAVSERAAMCYLLSSPYQPAYELEVHPFDAELAIPWRLRGEAVLSAKDAAAPGLAERRDRGELPTFVA